ncbi:plastocyanin/azurin family copper-binding protein [Ottowia sp.]|jgi:plastocyanin|uniref:cupredoxin domain-containing protein n=1 Tax=Ottowia sp. TaxID=1898956 RepID=UPI002CC126E9|nr:plastocyanin/azurin family copper-binding protein [Ottowia sp.]HRN77089.1 plastocyanin/azurin family copper-binding protein [Ottowia sp.]HRO52825.1 plastocyanin/azurin family copper-binding protein [Alicycliphilus sp.]HRQ03985.1 plastocyanin/azurin family copper-binding protein [Ottowia sp.]
MSARTLDMPRRRMLWAGGGLLLLPAWLPSARAHAASEIEIAMSGAVNGAEVWFRPRGLLIQPGQAVRWVNRDQGNVHTATAYHPEYGKPLRIPHGAKPWDSDYLMPGQSFAVVFDVPGVYDYFCIPHEQAGMVARIVVGKADTAVRPYADTDSELPPAALVNLVDVEKILKQAPRGTRATSAAAGDTR